MENAFEFYADRIAESENKLQYYAQMIVTCTSSSDHWFYSKQCAEARIELEVWDEKAREEGIYIV